MGLNHLLMPVGCVARHHRITGLQIHGRRLLTALMRGRRERKVTRSGAKNPPALHLDNDGRSCHIL